MTQIQNTSQSRLKRIVENVCGASMMIFLGAFFTVVCLKSCEAEAGYQSATASAQLDKKMGVK